MILDFLLRRPTGGVMLKKILAVALFTVAALSTNAATYAIIQVKRGNAKDPELESQLRVVTDHLNAGSHGYNTYVFRTVTTFDDLGITLDSMGIPRNMAYIVAHGLYKFTDDGLPAVFLNELGDTTGTWSLDELTTAEFSDYKYNYYHCGMDGNNTPIAPDFIGQDIAARNGGDYALTDYGLIQPAPANNVTISGLTNETFTVTAGMTLTVAGGGNNKIKVNPGGFLALYSPNCTVTQTTNSFVAVWETIQGTVVNNNVAGNLVNLGKNTSTSIFGAGGKIGVCGTNLTLVAPDKQYIETIDDASAQLNIAKAEVGIANNNNLTIFNGTFPSTGNNFKLNRELKKGGS